jgi:hypothetical protein
MAVLVRLFLMSRMPRVRVARALHDGRGRAILSILFQKGAIQNENDYSVLSVARHQEMEYMV